MKFLKLFLVSLLLILPVLTFGVQSVSAQAPPTSWQDIYDPLVLRHYNVRISQSDYQTIRYDETFDIKVPAVFWANGEDIELPIRIRRKSATPIGDKISYRLDFTSGLWHGVKTMSLENGDDNNVVSEGLSWYFHRRASNTNYKPSLAAWSTVTLHVVVPVLDEFGAPVLDENGNPLTTVEIRPQGVYLNVELPDKYFMINRGIWSVADTYLYKQDDIGLPELKESPTGLDSPAYGALNYSPFQATVKVGKKVINPTPSDAVLEQQLNYWINMDTMLRLGAVNAYSDNPDELFNKGKNYFWADYETAFGDFRRVYFPWDLDASIRSTTAGIYGTITTGGRKATVIQHPYQQVILNHPTFRTQYNQTMLELVDGPMSVGETISFLNQLQPVLVDALAADPNGKLGSTPEEVVSHFDYLRNWVTLRDTNVRSQISKNGPPAPRTVR